MEDKPNMATRSGQQYQRTSTSLPDLTTKEDEPQRVLRNAGTSIRTSSIRSTSIRSPSIRSPSIRSPSIRSPSRQSSISPSTRSNRNRLEAQLAIQEVEMAFKEKEVQLQMEKLKIQKELAMTKALLEAVNETDENESLYMEDKFDLQDIPDEKPADGVRRFLNTLPQTLQNVSPATPDETHNPKLIKQLVDSFRLPPLRVTSFNGDPLKYPMWETSFDSLIGDKALSAGEKLNLLSQYLVGEPHDMVSSYMLLQDEGAYQLARDELKSRYGNDSVISKAFLTKLNDWPKIGTRDSSKLRKFSDFLNEVSAAKKRIPDLGLLDYKQENYKIISKIVLWLPQVWA